MQFEKIVYAVEDGVARITINRPEASNALDVDTLKELMHAATHCDEDPAVRVAVLTGAGDSFFSAGGDLKSFHGVDEVGRLLKEGTTYIHAAISRFSRMRAPLLVAVNGIAAGGGLSLAVIGDLVVATESARFTTAYTAAGLSPDGSGSYFIPRLVGLRRAQELFFTARQFTAAEAAEMGLITKAVPDAAFAGEIAAMTDYLANGPTEAFATVKRLLLDSFSNTLETQMELETRGMARSASSADGREGVDAFATKRTPRYRGA